MSEAIVQVTRGSIVESCHRGSVAVTNGRGDLIAYVGNPDFVTYIRSAAKPVPCTVLSRSAKGLLIAFEEPARAPAPGQAAVLYDGELLVGGGPIREIYADLPDC